MITGAYLNNILRLAAKHSLYREDGKWYHNLKSFPGALFDRNGFIIFQTEKEYFSNQYLQRKKDLHVKNGIQSLSGYQKFSESERQLIDKINLD